MDTLAVGRRLVELCKQGHNRKAIEELYAEDAVSTEPMPGPTGDRVTRGKAALLKGSDWFFANHTIHSSFVDGPYPCDDAFICMMGIDLTAKAGPLAGQRMEMKEAARYTVKNGKITSSTFYYPTDEMCKQ